MSFLSRLRPRHLLLSWLAYWAGLVTVTLGDFIAAVLAVSRAGTGSNSSVGAGMNNGVFDLNVVKAGITTYTGTAHWATVAFWLSVPPLLLWIFWLFGVSRGRRDRTPDALGAGGGAMPDFAARAREPVHADAPRDDRSR